MDLLSALVDLQRTLDLLQTIDRDLTAYPPDLAELHRKVQSLEKAQTEDAKRIEEAKARHEPRAKEVAIARKGLERTQEELKKATSKVQYAALIREKEDRDKQLHALLRPLKELETSMADAETRRTERETELTTTRAQFEELRAVFLAEHGNQVAGREELEAKRSALETAIPAPDLARFRKVAQARAGKAVVAASGGLCLGCRTRLRPSLLHSLRDSRSLVSCEACQRFLYLEN